MGVDVNFQGHSGNSALADAAREGHLDIVRQLLVIGANVNLRDNDGNTALSIAIEAGHETVAELLRQYGGGGP